MVLINSYTVVLLAWNNDIIKIMFAGPPSKCRNLRVKEVSTGLGTAVLHWTRPVITGRQDLYYNVYLSDPDITGGFLKDNSDPVFSDSVYVEYSLSGLRPLTKYKARVFPHNGVSERDQYRHIERMCEFSWTSSDESMLLVG